MRKFALQNCMLCYIVGHGAYKFDLSLHLCHNLCLLAAKALTRHHGCTDLSEPSLFVYAMQCNVSN